ncbi:MAG TPA: response regulator [Caulobacteraceae bacterium]|nr:response regulator [Caulobacteraceae bacterium]
MGYVLVVDDNLYNVKLLEARLQIAGYAVETAFNGEEALAAVGRALPDIVLLDVMMPGMDGYEVCRRIRADAATADLPVVFVSALDKPSDRAAGMAAGGDDFITKPVEDGALFPAIERLTAPGARAGAASRALIATSSSRTAA